MSSMLFAAALFLFWMMGAAGTVASDLVELTPSTLQIRENQLFRLVAVVHWAERKSVRICLESHAPSSLCMHMPLGGSVCRDALRPKTAEKSEVEFSDLSFPADDRCKLVHVRAAVEADGTRLYSPNEVTVAIYVRHAKVNKIGFGIFRGDVSPLSSVAVHLPANSPTILVKLEYKTGRGDLFVYSKQPLDAPGPLDMPFYSTEGNPRLPHASVQYVNNSVYGPSATHHFFVDHYFVVFSSDAKQSLKFVLTVTQLEATGAETDPSPASGWQILGSILLAILEGLA